ncbi:putative cytochrome B domain protein, partial [Toxoplasma gondii ARI]
TVEAKCVTYLVREVAAGWEFKTLHATTASFVFVCIFVHVTRILSRFHTQRLIS